MGVIEYLGNSKVVFLVFIAAALLVPQLSYKWTAALIPILMIMMTFSIKNLQFRLLRGKDFRRAVYLNIANYVALGALMIILALLLIKDPVYQKAVFMLAIMPPAVGIISLTYLLKGDVESAFLAESLGYAAGVIIIPIASYFIIGNGINPLKILEILGYIIVIPFVVSRLIRNVENEQNHIRGRIIKAIVNVCYGALFFIVIGINRDALFSGSGSIIRMLLLFVLVQFVFGTFIWLYLKNKTKRRFDVLYVLFGTVKNGSIGAATALMLFGMGATLPFAVYSIVGPAYILFLEWMMLAETK